MYILFWKPDRAIPPWTALVGNNPDPAQMLDLGLLRVGFNDTFFAMFLYIMYRNAEKCDIFFPNICTKMYRNVTYD